MSSDSLRRLNRTVPTWWADAKLGIFVHWVPASVPGYAPTALGIRELLCSSIPNPISETPYSEWYQNSLRFAGSSVARFHAEHHGDRPYESFAADFVAGTARWDPVEWAERFAATGAGYVVLVAKHHDGWCLWPSEVANPRRPAWHSERDLVGDLCAAVRAAGMRFGVYYSGGYDWTFDDTPIGTMADGLAAVPRGDYVDYATAQVTELIERYAPSVLWNDIAWPSTWPRLAALFEHYFDRVPDGVVNDRWLTSPDLTPLLRLPGAGRAVEALARRSVRRHGLVPPRPRFFQFRTPEFTTRPGIDLTPWEVTRGMDAGFGYNRTSAEADFLSRDELIGSLVDTVAKGGNLLLNVGPRGEDAQVPAEQLVRLGWLAEWMAVNRDCLIGTRPWVRARSVSPEGFELHFTARGERVWALIAMPGDGPGGGDARSRGDGGREGGPPARVTLPFLATARTEVRDVTGTALPFDPTPAGIVVELPFAAVAGTSTPFAIAVDGAVAHPSLRTPSRSDP